MLTVADETLTFCFPSIALTVSVLITNWTESFVGCKVEEEQKYLRLVRCKYYNMVALVGQEKQAKFFVKNIPPEFGVSD